MFNPWAIIGVIGLVAATAGGGYWKGQSDCRAAFALQELKLQKQREGLKEARRAVELERYHLTQRLAEEAYAEPVLVERCLSPSRVQRLNSLR